MKNTHSRNLIISGTVYSIIIFLWPVFMMLSSDNAGSLEQKVRNISSNGTFYYINFIIASLIAPSIIVLISITSNLYRKEKFNLYDTIGVALLIGYSILNSISYITQYSILPALIKKGQITESVAWLFDNKNSVVYFFNQMGYCIFGISIIMIFKGFLKEKSLNKVIALFFCISGVLSIIAFIGLLIHNETLNILTVVSGLLIVPVGILAIISGIRDKKLVA